MTQFEMTEKISEKTNVSLEEARAALEAGDWNMLTATHLLDQEKFRRMQQLNEVAADCDTMAAEAATEEAAAEEQTATIETAETTASAASAKRSRGQGLKNLGRHIRDLIVRGNRNRFAVRRNGATVIELPVTAMALLLICAFWFCVVMLVVGLFTGCRYSFEGPDLGRKKINNALGKASDAVEHMKHTVAEA